MTTKEEVVKATISSLLVGVLIGLFAVCITNFVNGKVVLESLQSGVEETLSAEQGGGYADIHCEHKHAVKVFTRSGVRYFIDLETQLVEVKIVCPQESED